MIGLAIVLICLVAGSVFMFVAGFGIFRMPDLFTRMHAATKAASLGVGLLLVGAAVHFGDLGITTKAVITIIFIFFTAPVAAHMLGRSAYRRRVPLWKESVIDEARGVLGKSDQTSDG